MKTKIKLTKTKYMGGMNYQKWDAYLILFAEGEEVDGGKSISINRRKVGKDSILSHQSPDTVTPTDYVDFPTPVLPQKNASPTEISVMVVTSPYALHTETFSPNKHFIFNIYVSSIRNSTSTIYLFLLIQLTPSCPRFVNTYQANVGGNSGYKDFL